MSQFLDGPEGLYLGSSVDQEPDEDPALKHAIRNAYEKGMATKSEDERVDENGDPRTFVFEVEAIFIEGTNPPSDYKVRIKDHGHT